MKRACLRRLVFAIEIGLIATGLLGIAHWAWSQEQIDLLDQRAIGSAQIAKMTMRARVVSCMPPSNRVQIAWRRGGEGLGGTVTRGQFPITQDVPDIDKVGGTVAKNDDPGLQIGQWTAWTPLEIPIGRPGGTEFITVTAASSGLKQVGPLGQLEVEFEFASGGKTFKKFKEAAPHGATVGFVFPGGLLSANSARDPKFLAALQGLADYAKARRVNLEKAFPDSAPLPKKFAVIGHLGGYGSAKGEGRGGATGFGVRHCNPNMLADECHVLRMLGVNSMVGGRSLELADIAGLGDQFRQLYWGGPGSGSPMAYLQPAGKSINPPEGCPFDPTLKPHMAERIQTEIAEHKAMNARESWALWIDEIGVAAKQHHQDCPRCREEYCQYLRLQKIAPADVGAKSWDDVRPYRIWPEPQTLLPSGLPGPKPEPPRPPATAAECLSYYYSFRFMTYATGQLFPESAKTLHEAGIPLYAMQGPTPSWSGSSLDWHEFYDQHGNTAAVFETSNRDPRVWQWESYLGDIMRGVAARHAMPMGCLVKPHRGAPEQRMLSVVSRGVRAIEWYTYGPDYSKGDSFSQSPELLEVVTRAARFLGRGEDQLYEARWAGQPEVAFVTPRSSEIWTKQTGYGAAAFENAKWVYLALNHAHLPVEIVSEQQLAEGVNPRYKVLYIPGPFLRRDAAAQVAAWVQKGGTLWTDALGLARDEANQPADALYSLLGLGQRNEEKWGSVPNYGATALQPLVEKNVPEHVKVAWEKGVTPWAEGEIAARIGREPLDVKDATVLARFSDGQPAIVTRKHGQGEVFVVGLWTGVTYSAQVRQAGYDMRRDFSPALRALIAAPAIARGVYRPVVPAEPLVESVLLEKDGRRSIALINWSYQVGGENPNRRGVSLQAAKELRIELPGLADVKAVRSQVHGPLAISGQGPSRGVVLPRLEAIDLLTLE